LTRCFLARRLSPLIAACSSLASVGKVMAFGCTVVSTVTRSRSGCVTRRPRAPPASFRPATLQLVVEPLEPVAQVRALVRERVLKELFAGKVLEIRVVDPALAHHLIGQAVNYLSGISPIMKRVAMPGRPSRYRATRSRRPVNLAGKLNQLALHIDDLVQQIARSRRPVLLRSHRPSDAEGIMLRPRRDSRKRNCKVPRLEASKPCNLKTAFLVDYDSRSVA
jgi:hypothetical protein